MLTAICRYGPRIVPETRKIVDECRARGETIEGPEIARFEQAFAHRLGAGGAVAASYGRMAFFYILKAFDYAQQHSGIAGLRLVNGTEEFSPIL